MDEPWTIELEDLEHARRLVARYALATPIVPAPAIAPNVWLKLETDQLTGAFKVRGALSRLARLSPRDRRRGVVTASAGNHGLGVAFAASKLGVVATVFVPASAPRVKTDGIAALGAKVVRTPHAGYDDTEALARAHARDNDLVFISPYDDPLVAAGNGGTIAFELLEQCDDLCAVVTPVGGGGLAAGLVAGFQATGVEVSIHGAQSDRTRAMHDSIAEGRAVTHCPPGGSSPGTVAEGLEGGVSESTYRLVRDGLGGVDLVSEEQTIGAMRFAHRELGLGIEGSAAVAIAWARAHRTQLTAIHGTVIVVVTGGNVDPGARERYLDFG